MAKKRMPIYGIIGIFRDFLAYNLANYKYFSMSLSLFNSTIKSHMICKFQLNICKNMNSMAKKHMAKNHKIAPNSKPIALVLETRILY